MQLNHQKITLYLSIGLFLNTSLFAETHCFLAKEDNQVIASEGDCEIRHSPCSTFKIAISLMGYNERFLRDETYPVLPFIEGYVDYIDSWKQPQNPSSWIKTSCVWYSQLITKQLGVEKFRNYVQRFDYGNQDVSGDIEQNNGLTNSWLSSSLEISPEEQVAFLQKLIANNLPVSRISHEMTKNILFVEDLTNGWKLYGKTGSGYLLNQNRIQKLKYHQIHWYTYIFSQNETQKLENRQRKQKSKDRQRTQKLKDRQRTQKPKDRQKTENLEDRQKTENLEDRQKTQNLEDRQIGWYIGWIQKDNRTIVFAYYLEDEEKQDTYASIRARETAKEKLRTLVQTN